MQVAWLRFISGLFAVVACAYWACFVDLYYYRPLQLLILCAFVFIFLTVALLFTITSCLHLTVYISLWSLIFLLRCGIDHFTLCRCEVLRLIICTDHFCARQVAVIWILQSLVCHWLLVVVINIACKQASGWMCCCRTTNGHESNAKDEPSTRTDAEST